jgi:hypothetical protein
MLLGDGLMGQVMEPVIFPDFVDPEDLPKKDWVLDGCKGRKPRALFSMLLGQDGELYKHNLHLQEKYDQITAQELRWETKTQDDDEMIIVAYGTAARIAESAIEELKAENLKVGLFRPITLWPYPMKALRDLASNVSKKSPSLNFAWVRWWKTSCFPWATGQKFIFTAFPAVSFQRRRTWPISCDPLPRATEKWAGG